MTDTNTNNGNGSTGETSTPLTGNASTRAQARYLEKLAAQAVEAVRGLAFGVHLLNEHLGTEPTQEQRDTFSAWLKAEGNGGATQADHEREVKMIKLWRELHPNPGFSSRTDDNEVPF